MLATKQADYGITFPIASNSSVTFPCSRFASTPRTEWESQNYSVEESLSIGKPLLSTFYQIVSLDNIGRDSLAVTLLRDNEVTQYISKLYKTARFIRSSKHPLAVYLMLLSTLWNSQKMMNGLRLSLSQYQNGTSTSRPNTVYQEAYEVRERLLKIRELANNNRLFMPLATFLDRIAIDWDDFVEECVLVMDPEIENLLRRLENVL